MRRNKASVDNKGARVIAHRMNGTTHYMAVCKRHKKPWTSLGAEGLGSHNGAHMAARQHRAEHAAADARRKKA